MSAPRFGDTTPRTIMQRIDNALDTAERYAFGDPLFKPSPTQLKAALADARAALRESTTNS